LVVRVSSVAEGEYVPLRLVVDHGKPLVQIEATGRIEARDVFDNFQRLELEGLLAYPKLVDARRIQVGFRPETVMEFAACINGLGAVEVLGALAVVATSDQATDMARRYINLSKGQRPVKLFSSPTKALKWLGAQQPQTFRGSARILVVDDDKGVLAQTVEMLSSLGYWAIPAASGAEALTLLERHQDVDLLFTDVVMPGEVTARALAARALKMRPDLKVLFVSGYFEGTLVDSERLGSDVQFLAKPYRKKELAQKIKSVLSGAS
jgi:CheY-like chemotaxis protein